MRFAMVHKSCAYLLLLVALTPISMAGDLPLPVLSAFLLATAASWFFEPGPPKAWVQKAWELGLVFLSAALILDAYRGGGILLNFEYFLLAAAMNRLWNLRTSRDYLWLYALSFVMLVIATTVSTGISFLFLFLLYIVLLVWNLIFHHLRREMEENYLLRHADAKQSERVEVARVLNSRRIVSTPFLAGTALASLGIFVSALVVFFLFPRVGFGFVFGPGQARTTMAGFSDTVKLGQHGTIKDNPEVVMRVRMPKPPQTPIRWRGAAFSVYADGRWTHGDEMRFPLHERVGPSGRHVLFSLFGYSTAAELQKTLNQAFSYEVFLEPIDSSVVFAADRPLVYEIPTTQLGQASLRLFSTRDREVRSDRARANTLQYIAYSDLSPPSEATLRGAPDEPLPAGSHRYLALPETLPSEVIQMAREITRDTRGPYEKAAAIRDHLVRSYRYTLELKHDDRLDPVYEFLFVRRAGHCEYFATAMAILLRAVGVPTRVVNGFYGGAWNDVGQFLAVRQGDAHSWVEVFLPNAGWVAFEPTPPAGQIAESRIGYLRMVLDAARLAWTRWIIEYDLAKQVDVLKKGARWLGGKPLPPGWAGAREAALRLLRRLLVVAGLLVVLVLLWRHLPHRKSLLGPRSTTRASADPSSQLYRKMLARLEKQGLRKRPSETPAEFAVALRRRGHQAAPIAVRVTDVYYEAQFGGIEPDPALLARLRDEVKRIGA